MNKEQILRAAQYIAQDRADLGRTDQYWVRTLTGWIDSMANEEVACWGTAGFVFSKDTDEAGEPKYSLTRQVYDFYPDGDTFSWVDYD